MENVSGGKSQDELRAEEVRKALEDARKRRGEIQAARKSAEEAKRQKREAEELNIPPVPLHNPPSPDERGEAVRIHLPPAPIEESPTITLPTLPPPSPEPEALPIHEELPAPEDEKTFRYTAMDRVGEEFSGTIKATNHNTAREKVRQMGLYPSFVKEEKGTKGERRGERYEREENGNFSERKTGFWKRNWLKFALSVGLIGGGYGVKKAIDYTGKEKKSSPALKLAEKKSNTKKKVYTAPPGVSLTNLAKEVKKTLPALPATNSPTAEEITAKVKAELEKKYSKQLADLAASQAVFSNKLASIESAKKSAKSAPATSPKPSVSEKHAPKTYQESIADIKQKIREKKPLSDEEAIMMNNYIISGQKK